MSIVALIFVPIVLLYQGWSYWVFRQRVGRQSIWSIKSFRGLVASRTTLMITHRLAGLEMMDEILVLHEGRVVERGSHAELLQAEGIYWRMWSSQDHLENIAYSGYTDT